MLKEIIDSLGAFPIIQMAVAIAIALIAVPIALRGLRDKGQSSAPQSAASNSTAVDVLIMQALARIEKTLASIARKLDKGLRDRR